MTETVTSPAGDQVELVDVGTALMWSAVSPLVRALWQEGSFTDESGAASRPWWLAARRRGYTAKLPAVNGFFNRGLEAFVTRDIVGKRCYGVRLTAIPMEWFDGRLDEAPPPPAHNVRRRQVACEVCGKVMGRNNLARHMAVRHDVQAVIEESRQRLSADVEHRLAELVDDEPVMILPIHFVTDMLGVVRPDGTVPIRCLPMLQEWIDQTEKLFAELARG